MDAVERVAKVLRREVPDRVPVGLHNFLPGLRVLRASVVSSLRLRKLAM
jgi:hypothetical protein